MAIEQTEKDGAEQPETEYRLRERERFLRMLISNLPGMVFQSNTDAEFTKEFVSDGCFELTGYLAEELVGANALVRWNELIHREDRERVCAELLYLSENQQSLDGEQFQISYRFVARDDSIKCFRDRFRFVHDSARKIKTVEGFTTDVTKRLQAEADLRRSEEKYRTLFDSIDEGFGVCEILYDTQGKACDFRFLEVNPAFEHLTGLKNAAGKTMRELVPNIENHWVEVYERVARTGEPERFTNRAEAINSWFEVFAFRVGEPENRRVAILFNNITTRKQAEMNLAFLAEISQILVRVRNVDEIMETVGAKIGAFLHLSNCVFAEIDETADEAIITHDWHQPDAPDLPGVYQISELVSGEFLDAARAGEIFVVGDTQTDSRTDAARYAALKIGSFVSVPLVQKGERQFLLAVYHTEAHDWRTDEIELLREITVLLWTRLERIRALSELRESENRYKLLAENMRDMVCLHDLEGKFVYVSPSSETMLGYAPAELVGISIYELIHPEDIEFIREAAHQRLLNGTISSIVVEFRMHDKKGDYYWFETMAQNVVAPSGEIVQLQTVSRDVTKRKDDEDEREKNQKELAHLFLSEQEARRETEVALVKAEHASRAKDEFLQMVSHEFRTPLTTIKTLVRVLQHDGKSEAERRKYLETIAAECDRQIDMILNLLDVSRFDEGDVDLKHEPVDISRVLNSCDKIERAAAESRKQILTIEIDESLPQVSGDEKAIRRALCTIIENAIKYTPEAGMISVTARRVSRLASNINDDYDREIAAKLFGDLPKQMDFSGGGESTAEEIAVIVCDTGRGILPEDIPRIFQKFYRGAKPHADASTDGTPDDAAGRAETPGVGLGLYLAKRLITALDGRITVNSQVGRGSCFIVFLPLWNEDSLEKDTIDEYEFDEK